MKKSCVKGLAKISSYNGQQIILIKMAILAFKGPYFFKFWQFGFNSLRRTSDSKTKNV